MNKCIFICRPTTDPKISENVENGEKKVARFTGAVTREYKRNNDPSADFFQMVAFSKQAEYIDKYVKKGDKISVVGRMQNNNYDSDGKTVYGFQYIIESVKLEEKNKNTQSSTGEEFLQADQDIPFDQK